MLPKKFINPHRTPARGLIINRLIDRKSLVLIEEVWQFKGLHHSPLTEMCFSSGRIKQVNWGWQEVPELIAKDKYLIIPAQPYNLVEPTYTALETLVRRSIQDFQEVNGFI